MISVVTWP
jgi:hypothetical protein